MPTLYKKWTEDSPIEDLQLLTHWERFIHHVAWKVCHTYHLGNEDKEDIVADIQLRLLKLRQEKRAFDGYVRVCVNNAARDYIADRLSSGGTGVGVWKESITMGFGQAAGRKDPQDDEADDADRVMGGTVSPEAEWVSNITLAQAMREALTPVEAEVIRLQYEAYKTLAEIGAMLGMSHTTVRNMAKAATQKLSRWFSDREEF